MAEVPIYYIDACVFLDLFDPDRSARHPAIKQVIDKAKAKKCRIITSIISITEVANGANEKSGWELDQSILDDIDAYWHPESPVRLAEVSQLLTYSARSLQREALKQGIGRVGSIDAIHLATAVDEKVDVLLTYDAKMHGYGPLVRLSIQEPVLEDDEEKSPGLFDTSIEGDDSEE